SSATRWPPCACAPVSGSGPGSAGRRTPGRDRRGGHKPCSAVSPGLVASLTVVLRRKRRVRATPWCMTSAAVVVLRLPERPDLCEWLPACPWVRGTPPAGGGLGQAAACRG